MLSEKIRNLQSKTTKIEESLRNTVQNSMSQISSSSSIPHQNISQLDEVLKLIETKIQIIIQETKKIIEKITTEFDKKLSQGTNNKDREQNAISKIQQHCRDSIFRI